MRTKAEFILDQPRLTFAAHFRGTTPAAVSIPIAVGTMEGEEHLSRRDQDDRSYWNRQTVALFAEDVIVT
ncbi:hypothetical protein, partial [Acinetobacter johnsonii]|uniref:hypothetical protein n=1 Tax=Acinetobacter johnsonii TaxID=40214 RepID=UPI001F3FA313